MRKNLGLLCYLLVLIAISPANAGSYEDFFSALERNDAAAVQSLLRRGFDPNTRDPQGQVGLFLALRSPSIKVAEVLIEHPAIEIDAANLTAETPLMMAALRGQLDWCRRLVERGARIDREGWTPLHYAATGPNSAVVAWLVERQARVDARSPNGTTPLMMAAGYGSEAGADELLRRGADPSLRNQQGMRAVDFARSVGRDSLAAKLDRATR